ncbi:MAG: TlpA family protein disulfide reductase [Dysgonomonas sp.]|nr:TlpA family protein disulfide reductase [Dysgonomonas sp.]
MRELIYIISFLFIYSGYSFYCPNFTNDDKFPDPEIKCGVAKISGRLEMFDLIKQYDKAYDKERAYDNYCIINKPLTGEYEKIKIDVDEDGSFSLEIPIEYSPAIGRIHLFSKHSIFFVPLVSGEETVINFRTKDNNTCYIEWVNGPDFVLENVNIWTEAFLEALQAPPLSQCEQFTVDTIKRFIANPKDFIPFAMKYSVKSRVELLEKHRHIPQKIRNHLADEVRIINMLQLYHYRGALWTRYNAIKSEEDTTTCDPPEPDLSYYIFLKEFDLNNPHNLYLEKFHYIIQTLLENETLSIPLLKEKEIDEWLKQVKDILANLVGFDDGMFYDALVCNAYSKQFSDRMEPLSQKQIENIQNYYKGGEVEKILLRENERILQLDKKRHQTIVNPTPEVKKELLIETILSKYKGKVVFIDYWATWCGPCMSAMADMASMKTKMINKDVVFVYIASESSPKKRWQEVIPGIGGEHYYLTEKEWKYISEKFDIRGVPTYQFYDKNGNLYEQVTGFPGVNVTENNIYQLQNE